MRFHNNQPIYGDSDFFPEVLVSELPTLLGLDVEIYHVHGQEMVKLSDAELL
ncbi:MAG TPA: hypothetical protein V6D12_16100 [Candidatus Obscuribacterales bacterium]